MRRATTSVEVSPTVFDSHNRWIQTRMVGTAYVVSNNYYKAEEQDRYAVAVRASALRFLTNVLGCVPLKAYILAVHRDRPDVGGGVRSRRRRPGPTYKNSGIFNFAYTPVIQLRERLHATG